jgi:hypothetical protein
MKAKLPNSDPYRFGAKEALAVFGILGAIGIGLWLTPDSGGSSRSSEAMFHDVLAERACERYVAAQLKAPSTAEFTDTEATGIGAQRTVSGSVDAQNGFGAMIRSSFTCDVELTQDEATVADATIS